MPVKLSKNSRLRLATLLSVDGVEQWDLLDLGVYQPRSDDAYYTASSSDRIDNLAYKLYGDPTLWWVLAWANDMYELPTDLYSGQILTVPSKGYVTTSLFADVVQ